MLFSLVMLELAYNFLDVFDQIIKSKYDDSQRERRRYFPLLFDA